MVRTDLMQVLRDLVSHLQHWRVQESVGGCARWLLGLWIHKIPLFSMNGFIPSDPFFSFWNSCANWYETYKHF